MSVTKIDCQILEGRSAGASFVALNPCCRAGSLVFATSTAIGAGLSGQIACKLALEHFVDGVMRFFSSKSSEGSHGEHDSNSELSVEILEAAVRQANRSVFDFGNKLAAGGRMAASLLGFVIEDNLAATARIGGGNVYLSRSHEVFPFFVEQEEVASGIIGANALVSVELASVPVESGDLIIVLPREIPSGKINRLFNYRKDLVPSLADIGRSLLAIDAEIGPALVCSIGPEAIYLSQRVS